MKNSGYAICYNKWLFDKEIKDELRLLLLISSYSAPEGFCYATNEHFAEKFKEDTTTISKKISRLEDLGYIRIESKKKGCIVLQRKIFINDFEKINIDKITVGENTNRTISENTNRTVGENAKYNIINLNNNINNTNNIIKENIKRKEKKIEIDNFSYEICLQIKNLVANKKKIKIEDKQLKNWVKEINKLLDALQVRGEEQAKEDIRKAIKFLLENEDNQFVPVVESGKSFREKFLKIEDSIKRNSNTFMKKSNKVIPY